MIDTFFVVYSMSMNTVLITGVGKGIGNALARKFLAEGDEVIGTYFSHQPTFDSAVATQVTLVRLNLASSDSIRECAQVIHTLGKKIDIYINNAGVLCDEDETIVVIEKLRATLEVNLFGTIDLTERLVGEMHTPGGHIVNISSTAGSLALVDVTSSHYPRHYPSYKISKAGLNMYTRTLAVRLRESGVVVSAVHPGWVKTDMGGADAEMTPEEAAEHIYALAILRPETGQFWYKGKNLPW